MSLETPTILWPAGSRIERFLAYIFNRLSAAFGGSRGKMDRKSLEAFLSLKRYKSNQVCVELPAKEAYADQFEARTPSIDSQTKIFANEASALAPVYRKDMVIVVQQDKNARSRVQFLQMRKSTLSELERHARKLGIESLYLSSNALPVLALQHPSKAAQRHLERKSLTLGLALCLTGIWAVLSVVEVRSSESLRVTSAEETRLRMVLLERLDENRELSALGQLAAINPVARSPQGRLESITEITIATTDSTWWQHVELDDLTLRASGRSASAAASLTAVANAFSEYEVSFANAVSDTPEGDQLFTIEVRPGETLR